MLHAPMIRRVFRSRVFETGSQISLLIAVGFVLFTSCALPLLAYAQTLSDTDQPPVESYENYPGYLGDADGQAALTEDSATTEVLGNTFAGGIPREVPFNYNGTIYDRYVVISRTGLDLCTNTKTLYFNSQEMEDAGYPSTSTYYSLVPMNYLGTIMPGFKTAPTGSHMLVYRAHNNIGVCSWDDDILFETTWHQGAYTLHTSPDESLRGNNFDLYTNSYNYDLPYTWTGQFSAWGTWEENSLFRKAPRLSIVCSPVEGGMVTGGGIKCGTNSKGCFGKCQKTYSEGTKVKLTAKAMDGWTFLRWEDGETCNGNARRTITMNKDKTITAVFRADNSVSFPLDSSYRWGYGMCDPNYPGGGHKGHDIFSAAGNKVYAMCDGTIVADNTNTENNPKYKTKHKQYWNAVLIIRHTCNGQTVYGHYGHIRSSLENNDVKAGDIIGYLREAYNGNDERTKSNDHLHLGVNLKKAITSAWGIAPNNPPCSTIENQGWVEPKAYFGWE